MRIPRPGLRGKLALSIALVLLAALGITYLAVYRGTASELENRTESDLLKVRSFGKTSLREVKRKLDDMGLTLGMPLPEGVSVGAGE